MWLAIGSLIVGLISLYDVINGERQVIDYLFTLMPIFFYLKYRHTAKNWGGQFIEWNDNTIKYKTRQTKETTLQISDIKTINILLDKINFELKDNSERTLIIEDYTEYADRLRIKQNFKDLIINL
jgi:hypothetical protein